jgi:hypothetical protein
MHPERRLFGLAVRVVCLDDLDDDCCALANQERGNLLRDYNLLAGWCRGCVSPIVGRRQRRAPRPHPDLEEARAGHGRTVAPEKASFCRASIRQCTPKRWDLAGQVSRNYERMVRMVIASLAAATVAATVAPTGMPALQRTTPWCDVGQLIARIDLDAVSIYPKRSDAEVVLSLRRGVALCRLRIGQLRLTVTDYHGKHLYAGAALTWIEGDTFDAALRSNEELAAHLAVGIPWCDTGKPVVATVTGSRGFRLRQRVDCRR